MPFCRESKLSIPTSPGVWVRAANKLYVSNSMALLQSWPRHCLVGWFLCPERVSEVLPCEPWVRIPSVGITGFTYGYFHGLDGALWDFEKRMAVCDVFISFFYFHFLVFLKVDLNCKYCFYQTGRSFLERRKKLVCLALCTFH